MLRPDFRRAGSVCAVIVLLLALAPGTARSQSAIAEETLDTAQLVQRALSENPELLALHQEWASRLERAQAASSVMPQPRLSYTAYLLAIETRQGPQRHVVTLSQAFPWLRALRDAAEPYLAEADAAAARFDAAAFRIVFGVDAAALRVARAEELSALMARQRTVYQDVLDHQSAVMPFGGAEHGDLLRTSLMVEVLTDRIADHEAERQSQMAILSQLIRWDSDHGFRLENAPLARDTASLPSADELMVAVSSRNPGFDVLIAQARAAGARAEVAANRALPMPSASIGWGVVGAYESPLPGTGDGGRDVFMVGLSVPLPVFRGQYAHDETAHSLQQESFDDRADQLQWAYREEVARALIRIEEESQRIVRYQRDVLPTANDATEHYAISIAQGESNHTEYLLAFEQELQLQVAVVDARFAIALEIARLDMLTAGLLTEAAEDRPSPTIETYTEADNAQ